MDPDTAAGMGDSFDYWDCLDAQERCRYELTGQRMKRTEDESTDLDCSMDCGGGGRVSDGYNDYWSSPDTGYSSSPVVSAAASASGKNNVVVTRRLRGRRLNGKLYALRSVVPNITKMDKVSILKDAIEYIQQLQEQERRMLAEISLLESAAEVHGHGHLLTTTIQPVVTNAGHAMPPMKKTRRSLSFSPAVTPAPASAMAAASPPVEAVEVRVTGAGDKLLVVSVACRHRKDAMGKVCRALESLRLAVISANVTVASGTVTHTALVQRQEIHKSEMKELIETAITHVDVAASTMSSMSY